MDTLLTLDYGLMALLAILLFVAVIWLAKTLLLRRDVHADERERSERRSGEPMPPVPFYDSDRRLVTRDRRRGDRRGRNIVFTTTQELRVRSNRH